MTMTITVFARTALAIVSLTLPGPALAQAPQNDLLNATLWMQRAVEYKANSLSAFALAKLRLEQALADQNWTGAPAEQTGAHQGLPPPACSISTRHCSTPRVSRPGWCSTSRPSARRCGPSS